MSLVDHLSELRRRLFISVLAVVAGGVVGWMLAPRVMEILIGPLQQAHPGATVQFLTVSGGFFLYVKISLIFGVILGLPIIVYQVWQFVAPGLTPQERRAALPWIPASIVFFTLGVIVAFVTLPFAIEFLTGFTQPGVSESRPSGEAYYGFVTMMFLIFGAVMEFPIALVFLAKLGILNVALLKRSRRMVILGITIFAVVATPGGDPISPIVMASVMYVLFEFTIYMLSRNAIPEPPQPAEVDAPDVG
ncbi:MAG: twin-arginine translocase subunit TatC [Chloroflexi bacterium]|nr:twin-arginine translocase subunit TatC [Chloroflexota bacterium]